MRTSTQFAVAALLGATAFVPAMAVTPLMTTVTTLNSNTVTAVKTASRAAAGNAVLPNAGSTTTVAAGSPVAGQSVNITKFDTNTGILVGASLAVANVNVGVNTRISATLAASGTGRNATATSSGWVGSIAGAGFTTINSAPVSTTVRSCSSVAPVCLSLPSVSAFTTGTTSALNATRTIAAASLGAYAADDNTSVALTRTADGVTSVANAVRTTNSQAGSQFGFNGGTYALTYQYLKNSMASFEDNQDLQTKTLDFGQIMKNTTKTLSFTIFNVAASEGADATAGLQLLNITRSSGDAAFTTTATTFTNMLGGTSTTYDVSFAPTTVGTFTDSFVFNFKDFAKRTGNNSLDGIGVRNSSIELMVMGATVPEPATWAMLLAGFGLVGFSARRRRTTVAA